MGSPGVLQYFTIFLLYLYLNSGSSAAETPPLETAHKNKIANHENRILFFPSVLTSQLDTVPIVNPTTPGTTTPIVNPIESPPAPTAVTTPPTTPTTTTPTTPTTTTPTSPTSTTPTTSGGAWCIASPTAQETALQVALDYACGYGGADCAAIQPGASCYNPNTVHDHASYAFNDYYQKNPIPTSCGFGGTAQLTYTDPSSGNCHYTTPKTTTSISPPPPTITTPTIMSPPAYVPPTMTTPSGPTVYGVPEPTGLPSSATSFSCSFLLFFTTGIMGLLLAAIHL